jgi:DNA-binding MarR family transcriptional regulator
MTAPASPQESPKPVTARPPDELLLADVVTRLRRAMRRAARATDPENSLSVAQLELMSYLAEHPGARPGELARLLRLAPNSVTTLVNGLHARQLITRAAGRSDRRTVSLNLTPAGAQAVQQWQTTNRTILHDALGELHPAWQHVLSGALPALDELIRAIDATVDRSGPRDGPSVSR